MKSFFKYGAIPAVVFALLFCATMMLLPVLINVQKFLPQIENQVSNKTGRPFRIGSDFGLTFFPWLSVTFSDAHLGNPKGVEPGDFISVDSFEARVKLLPLLVNKVEVSRFIVSGLDINLKREESGAVNWGLPVDASGKNSNLYSWLKSKDLKIDLMAITGGTVVFEDNNNTKSFELDDIMLLLNNLSPDTTAEAEFKVASNGHVIKGGGLVGPVSEDLASLFMEMHMQLNDSVKAQVSGECSYPLRKTQCDLKYNILPFSLASFFSGGGKDNGEDVLPAWGRALSLDGFFHGDVNRFNVDNGGGSLDENSFTYALQYNRDEEISTQVEVHFTALDITKYLQGAQISTEEGRQVSPSTDLQSLSAARFSARVGCDELRFYDMNIHNVGWQLHAEGGKVKVDDGSFELHGGKGSFNGLIGLDTTPSSVDGEIKLEQVQAEALSQDLLGTPFVSGLLHGGFSYRKPGLEESELGDGFLSKGYLIIENGEIYGMDLFAHLDEADDPYGQNTPFSILNIDTVMGPKAINLQSFTVEGGMGKKEMQGVVDFQDSTFTLVSQMLEDQPRQIPLTGSFSSDGIQLSGYSDEEEASLLEMRDVQTIVDEKIPSPSQEDVDDSQGTPLIDAAVIAQRFGLKREVITPSKTKKMFNVGQGRVVIHELQELGSVDGF